MKKGTYKVKAKGHGSSFMPMEVTLKKKSKQSKLMLKEKPKGLLMKYSIVYLTKLLKTKL